MGAQKHSTAQHVVSRDLRTSGHASSNADLHRVVTMHHPHRACCAFALQAWQPQHPQSTNHHMLLGQHTHKGYQEMRMQLRCQLSSSRIRVSSRTSFALCIPASVLPQPLGVAPHQQGMGRKMAAAAHSTPASAEPCARAAGGLLEQLIGL